MNPQLSRYDKYATVHPAPVKKKVVVIGGGVAGMMAAKTLVERGHDVVLMEKRDHLGGLLPEISNLSFKEDQRRYCEWNVRTTMACGADIRLNCEATPESVMAEEPDAIFVCTGSVVAKPPVPGIDGANVYNVMDVDSGRTPVKGKVVVCGGGVSGCECALDLAYQGNEVTVVDMIPEEDFAKGLSMITRTMLLMLLEEHGVKLLGDRMVNEICEDGVVVGDRNWRKEKLDCDYVVEAFGMKSTNEFAEQFRMLIPEVYVVGDAKQVKNIKQANFDAYNLACNC